MPSISAGKNTKINLAHVGHGVVSFTVSGSANISKILGYHLLQQKSSEPGYQKLLQGQGHELTTYLSDLTNF